MAFHHNPFAFGKSYIRPISVFYNVDHANTFPFDSCAFLLFKVPVCVIDSLTLRCLLRSVFRSSPTGLPWHRQVAATAAQDADAYVNNLQPRLTTADGRAIWNQMCCLCPLKVCFVLWRSFHISFMTDDCVVKSGQSKYWVMPRILNASIPYFNNRCIGGFIYLLCPSIQYEERLKVKGVKA